MNLKDQGIILSVNKYNENSLIVKILSQEYGICSGFVSHAFKNSKNNYIYQIGNLVEFVWRSKNIENLGNFKIELNKSFLAFILESRLKLKCITTIINIIQNNILEKEPHQKLYIQLLNLLEKTNNDDYEFLVDYIKLEIDLLQILGYGIDLSKCVVTGAKEDLYFVSPKSGNAVSRKAGEKYRNKLLKLPNFLIESQDVNNNKLNKNDLLAGLKLSGFFINKYLYANNNLSIEDSRYSLINIVNAQNSE